jgi:hypothetical protein
MEGKPRQLGQSLGKNRQYAWKQRAYLAPASSPRWFQWKASALRGLGHLSKVHTAGQPMTVVVPALFNRMPAEGVALGWLNEIDSLLAIRHRIQAAAKLTGWDAFTFHTQHNLDSFYSSNIVAMRDTWLREGSLSSSSVAETLRRFGKPYDYHRIQARLVENLVFQSSLMEWLTAHASDSPVQFHVCGTALISALVWAGALTLDDAVRTAGRIGARWDSSLDAIIDEDANRSNVEPTDENLGWLRFRRIRQIIEGRSVMSLQASGKALPQLEAPAQPFWFSATANDEPVLIQTLQDVRFALEAMDLASWSPKPPRPLANDRIRGWLASPLHPMAATCRWSVYNYLLATPASSLLFLRHIAAIRRQPTIVTETQSAVLQNRFRLSRMKVTGP